MIKPLKKGKVEMTNQASDIGNKGGVERGAIIMDSTKIPKVRNPKTNRL